jgi:hypothetical protein
MYIIVRDLKSIMHITILEVIEEIKINILYHLYKMKVNSESLEILIILSK